MCLEPNFLKNNRMTPARTKLLEILVKHPQYKQVEFQLRPPVGVSVLHYICMGLCIYLQLHQN